MKTKLEDLLMDIRFKLTFISAKRYIKGITKAYSTGFDAGFTAGAAKTKDKK
jgi:hypothetical protein